VLRPCAEMVREAEAAAASGMVGEDEVRAAQEKVSSEYSSNGVMWGYIGGSACLALSLLVVVALTLSGVSSRRGQWTARSSPEPEQSTH